MRFLDRCSGYSCRKLCSIAPFDVFCLCLMKCIMSHVYIRPVVFGNCNYVCCSGACSCGFTIGECHMLAPCFVKCCIA